MTMLHEESWLWRTANFEVDFFIQILFNLRVKFNELLFLLLQSLVPGNCWYRGSPSDFLFCPWERTTVIYCFPTLDFCQNKNCIFTSILQHHGQSRRDASRKFYTRLTITLRLWQSVGRNPQKNIQSPLFFHPLISSHRSMSSLTDSSSDCIKEGRHSRKVPHKFLLIQTVRFSSRRSNKVRNWEF